MSKLSLSQKLILITFIALVFNVAAWFLAIAPSREEIGEVEAKIAAEEQKETELRQRLAVLQAIDTEALEQEEQELLVRIPEVGLLREVITELEAVSLERSLELSSMSFSPPGLAEKYHIMNINLSISGTYANLYAYIEYLENHSRLILINGFNFSSSEENITSSISLSLYSDNFDPYTPHEAPGRDNPFVN